VVGVGGWGRRRKKRVIGFRLSVVGTGEEGAVIGVRDGRREVIGVGCSVLGVRGREERRQQKRGFRQRSLR